MSREIDERMASPLALRTAKREVRSLMKQALSAVSKESIQAQSNAVFDRLTEFRPYVEAKRISIYLSMPTSEIQTDAIVRHALGCGKQVYVPYLHKSENQSPTTPRMVMDMVDIRTVSEFDGLERDSWGIPTLSTHNIHERDHILRGSSKETPTKGQTLDLVLMPGVAFDIDPRTGFVRRLGHGKGFYDYFLHRYLQSRDLPLQQATKGPGTDVLMYGLALEEQFLNSELGPSVPVGLHDNLLHGLVVGNGEVIDGPVDERTLQSLEE